MRASLRSIRRASSAPVMSQRRSHYNDFGANFVAAVADDYDDVADDQLLHSTVSCLNSEGRRRWAEELDRWLTESTGGDEVAGRGGILSGRR